MRRRRKLELGLIVTGVAVAALLYVNPSPTGLFHGEEKVERSEVEKVFSRMPAETGEWRKLSTGESEQTREWVRKQEADGVEIWRGLENNLTRVRYVKHGIGIEITSDFVDWNRSPELLVKQRFADIQDLTWVETNGFTNSSNYTARVILPETYPRVYKCGGSPSNPNCFEIERKSDATEKPYYEISGGRTVVTVDHFSGVAGGSWFNTSMEYRHNITNTNSTTGLLGPLNGTSPIDEGYDPMDHWVYGTWRGSNGEFLDVYHEDAAGGGWNVTQVANSTTEYCVFQTLPRNHTSCNVKPDGLENYWALDESGNAAWDHLGKQHGVVLGGGVTQDADASFARGYSFDGTDDYVALNKSFNQSGAIDEFTATAWINVPSGGGDWSILDFDRSEYFTFATRGGTTGSSGAVDFATTASSGSTDDMEGSTNVSDGTWHQVAVTFDAGATNDKKIYVDGQLDAQKDAYGTGTNLGTGTGRYGFIGDGSEAPSLDGGRNDIYFTGNISEVRYYSRALNDAEINSLYNMQSSLGEEQIIPVTVDEPEIDPRPVVGKTFNITVNVSSPASIDTVLLNLTDASGTLEVQEAVMNNDSNIFDQYWYEYTMDTDSSSKGIWTADILANNTAGGTGTNTTRFYSLEPDWFNTSFEYRHNLTGNLSFGSISGRNAIREGFDPMEHWIYGTVGNETDPTYAYHQDSDGGGWNATLITNETTELCQIQTLPENNTRCPRPPQDLQGFWTFDEEGPVAWDHIKGRHGTLSGGVTQGATGIQGQSYSFGGGNEEVDTGLTASAFNISGSKPKTIMAWVYPRSWADDAGVWSTGDTGTTGEDFSMRQLGPGEGGGEGQWRAQLWGSPDIDFTFGGNNEWVHLAMTYDGSTLCVYANGTEIACNAESLNTADTDTLNFGEWDGGYIDARIDGARVYDRALSQAKVRAIQSRTSPLGAEEELPDNPLKVENPKADPDPVEETQTVNITVNVTDADNEVDQVLLNLTDAENNMELINAPMNNDSDIFHQYWYEYTVSDEASNPGIWQIDVYAENKLNYNDTNSDTFEVLNLDEVGPEWRRLRDDAGGSVRNTEEVIIEAEFLDNNSGVKEAYLSTNETGSWKNYSGVYASPENLGGSVDSWELADFVWSNQSFNGTLGYRIWGKDKADNWVLTNTSSFSVTKDDWFNKSMPFRHLINQTGVLSEIVGPLNGTRAINESFDPLDHWVYGTWTGSNGEDLYVYHQNAAGGGWNVTQVANATSEYCVFQTLPESHVRCNQKPSNLKLYWTFDRNGSQAWDYVGDRNGTLNNGVTQAQPSRIGRSYSFDGTDDYVSSGQTASQLNVDGGKPKTVMAWVYPRGTWDDGGIWGLGSTGTDGADFSLRELSSEGSWRAQLWGSSCDRDFTFGGSGQWLHMAMTWNGTHLNVYGNGTELVEDNLPSCTVNTGDGMNFQAGWWDNGADTSHFIDARIDGVRVYDRALTQSEIQEIYDGGPSLGQKEEIELPPQFNSWWNETWLYRKPIDVNNTADQELNNFQVRIDLNSTSVGPSFDWTRDKNATRITLYNPDGDNETLMNHWVENWTVAGQRATVWVNVTDIPASTIDEGLGPGVARLYYYYGNKNAEPVSNGTRTMDFFDDFEGTSLNTGRWNTNAGGNYDVNGNSEIELWGDWNGDSLYLNSVRNFSTPKAVGGRWKIPTTSDDSDISVGLVGAATNTWWNENDIFMLYDGNGGGTANRKEIKFKGSETDGTEIGSTAYQLFTVQYNTTRTAYYDTYTGDYINVTGTAISPFYLHIAGDSEDSSRRDIFDYIYIRKMLDDMGKPSPELLEEQSLTQLSVDIDRPQDFTRKIRGDPFLLNGSVGCTGDCGNVSAFAQYKTQTTPTETWREDSNSDFSSFNKSVNISVKDHELVLESSNPGAPWLDEVWKHRQNFNVSNTAGSDLSGYPVEFNLTSSKVGSGFNWTADEGHLKFGWYNSSSGNTYELDYWIETWDSEAEQATVWVNATWLEKDANTTIQMYYGSHLQDPPNTESSPDRIFDRFINFSEYTVESYAGSQDTDSSAWEVINGTTLHIFGNTWKKISDTFDIQDDGSRVIEMEINATNTAEIYATGWDTDDSQEGGNDYQWAGGQPYGNSPEQPYTDFTEWQRVYAIIDDIGAGTYDRMTFAVDDDGGGDDPDGTAGSADIYFKNIRLRDYADPEPQVLAGNEQEVKFKPSGRYVSSAFNTNDSNTEYEDIFWDASIPANTSLSVSARTSSDGSSWGSWFLQTNNSNIFADDRQYIQYRVEMATSDNSSSPEFRANNIEYKSTSSGWDAMQSSGTIFTADNPEECGPLGSGEECDVNWSVTPNQVGRYFLRFKANGTSGVENITVSRDIDVYAETFTIDFDTGKPIVGRGREVDVKAKLVDDFSNPLEGYDINFTDQTDALTIDVSKTNGTGWAKITYQVPKDASLGTHSLAALFDGSGDQYLLQSNATTTLDISSVPKIRDVNASPNPVGAGYNVTISANLTDATGVDTVLANVTEANGTTTTYAMANTAGGIYSLNYTNTWNLGEYEYNIWANNTDGIVNVSEKRSFQVNFSGEAFVNVRQDNYRANKDVKLSPFRDDWLSPDWEKRTPITVREQAGEDISDYPLKLSIDTQRFITSGEMQPDAGDLRFTSEKPIFQLPVTVDNSGLPSRNDEPVKIEVTDTDVISQIQSVSELRVFNQTTDSPYDENSLPIWVEELSADRLTLWVNVNSLAAGEQKTYYIYYGDGGQGSVSDYGSVFTTDIGETGKVQRSDSWGSESFTQSYSSTPVVVSTITSFREGGEVGENPPDDSSVTRIKDLDVNGFDLRVEEYPSDDGSHATENVSYVAMKQGDWLVAGRRITADTFSSNNGSEAYKKISFSDPFPSTPIFLTQINSYKGQEAGAHTRVDNITTLQAWTKIEEEGEGDPHLSETIGYLAVEGGTAESTVFEAENTLNDVTDAWYDVFFSGSYSETPAVIGKFQTEDGGDNMEERLKNLTSTGFNVSTEETPAYDGSHTDEVFGYMALEEGAIKGAPYKEQPSTSTGNDEQVDSIQEGIPYYIESGVNTTNTSVWVQIPALSAEGDTTVYMYYNNSNATSKSDLTEVMSYGTLKEVFYPVGSNNDGAADAVSFRNGNQIDSGSTTLNLDEQETGTLPGSDVSQASPISILKPAQVSGQENGADSIVPIGFAGKDFVYPMPRADETLYIYAPYETATVKVYDGTTNVENLTVVGGGVGATTVDIGGTGTSIPSDSGVVILNSSSPVLVYHQGDSSGTPADGFAFHEPAKELYGVPSENLLVGALEDGTSVDIYYSDGSSTTQSLDRGQLYHTDTTPEDGGTGDNGDEAAAHIVADKPVMAIQTADSDGFESTSFLPESELGDEYYVAQDTSYISVAAPEPATRCAVVDPSGVTQFNSTSDSATGETPSRLYFGNSTGVNIPAGSRMSCNASVFAIHEYATNDDEKNLWSTKASRQNVAPQPSYTVQYRKEQDRFSGIWNNGNQTFRGYLYMVVQRETATGFDSILPPVVNDRLSGTSRSIAPGEKLNITQIWEDKGGWNTDEYEPGTYRVLGRLEAKDGETLVGFTGIIEGTDDFRIINVTLELTDLEHENQYESGIREYEVGDRIDWVNVTATAINNTALDANITLDVFDDFGNDVPWGPSDTRLCGDIPNGSTCERRWDNSTNGYIVPESASSGSFDFFWNVTMRTKNGMKSFNDSFNFTILDIPSTFSSAINDTDNKVLRNESARYNFTFTNRWSAALDHVNVTANCNQAEISCDVYGESDSTASLGTVNAGQQQTVNFNITTNISTDTADYDLNTTLEYINPGGERRIWGQQENKRLAVRIPGALLSLVDIPDNITRAVTGNYTFKIFTNNTFSQNLTNASFKYWLPYGWTNSSGKRYGFTEIHRPGEIIWLNMTAFANISSSLGPQTFVLNETNDQKREDEELLTVDVYAESNLTLNSDDPTPDRGDTITLTGDLEYDNGNAVQGETVNFWDETEGLFIGSDTTDSNGIATVDYTLPGDAVLGDHELNATFAGSNSTYTRPSDDNETINVGQKPSVSDVKDEPDPVGYGYNVTINANVTDADGIEKVEARITYPDGDTATRNMTNVSQDIYEVNFTETWQNGKYDYTIWVEDGSGSTFETSSYSFELSVDAEVSVRGDNDTYGPNTNVLLNSTTQEWWNYSFSYRKPINITDNTGSDQQEVHVNLTVDTASFISAGKMNASCKDVRFTWYNSSSGNQVRAPHYLKSGCDSSETEFWVKVPEIGASATEQLYIYYGNFEAGDGSSQQRTFSYSSPRTVGYVVSNISASNGLSVQSLVDNNTVEVGANTYLLNETDEVTASSGISIDTPIRAEGLIQAEGNGDTDDIVSPVSWEGEEFVYGGMRGTDRFCMLATGSPASVTIYDGGSSVFSGTVDSTGTCTDTDITDGNAARITSDEPILAQHLSNDSYDSFPMYPATTDKVYGIPSTTLYVGAGAGGADIEYQASDGSSGSTSIGADSEYTDSFAGGGQAPAMMVNGSSPVGAIQQADGDGTESTVFVPSYEMTTKFGSGLSADYIVVATPNSGTECTFDNGASVSTKTVSGISGVYRLDWGAGTGTQYTSGGWKVSCTSPVTAYYEESEAGDEDETNLFGWPQMRREVSAPPTVSRGGEETQEGSLVKNLGGTDFRGFKLMKVEKYTGSGWNTVEVVVNDTSTGTSRSLDSFSSLDIASIWNADPWNTDREPAGRYRVRSMMVDRDGDLLQGDSGGIEGFYEFNITGAAVQANVTELRFYNVTSNPNKRIYTGDLEASGLNSTFTIFTNYTYRVEIDVENLNSSSGPWDLSNVNIRHQGLRSSWEVDVTDDIWYSNISDRTDTRFEGGQWFQGNVKWNTSTNGGTVAPGEQATFYYIFNLSSYTSEERPVKLNISDPNFLESDDSVLDILIPETEPPKIVNEVYYLTQSEVIRGNNFDIRGKWDETLGDAVATYNTTSTALQNDTINLPDPNPGHWTNYTISTSSVWKRGIHFAKLHAADEQSNWNSTLPFKTFSVWGLAQVKDSYKEEPASVYADWKYRQEISVDNTGGSALTDYQVAVNVSHTANMSANFSDLRFTWVNSTGGEEPIDYWVEWKSNGNWAYTWLEVPEIGAGATEKVYMYYNNSGSTSESNASEVLKKGGLWLTQWQDGHSSNAADESEMDSLFSAVSYSGRDGWAAQPRPTCNDNASDGSCNLFGGDDNYLTYLEGWIRTNTTGTYGFGTDSDDASDVHINGTQRKSSIGGTNVATWYGGHDDAGDFSNNGNIALEQGFYRYDYRHEEATGGDMWRGGWNPPYASSYNVIPASSLYYREHTDNEPNASFESVEKNGIRLGCYVEDDTVGNALANYDVQFYNETGQIGTAKTNSTGWAEFVYRDTSPGVETLKCNITEDTSRYYKIDSNNEQTFTTSQLEFVPPNFLAVSQNATVVNKTDTVGLNVLWEDNFQMDEAKLEINTTGSFVNESSLTLSSSREWANFSYRFPATMQPGTVAWRQWGKDSSNNYNVTPLSGTQFIQVWGRSEISQSSLKDSSIITTELATMECRVIDADSGSGLGNYPVEFYNSTGLMGTNGTASDGWAQFTWNDTTTGSENIQCQIDDNFTRMYNATVDTGSDTLNTFAPGSDVDAPKIVDGLYGLNTTTITKGAESALKVFGKWNEGIDNSTALYNWSSSINSYLVPGPYTANWTNYTIPVNESWTPGEHFAKLEAEDGFGNINDTLRYQNFSVFGRSRVTYDSPTGAVSRGIIDLTCSVDDFDTAESLQNYDVQFYEDGNFLDTNQTNSTGTAVYHWDASSEPTGDNDVTCLIQDDDAKYYKAEQSQDSETLTITSSLNTTIFSPDNGTQHFKGDTLWLNSTSKDSSGNYVSPDNVTWSNSTSEIATGENTTWTVEGGVGLEKIDVLAEEPNFADGTDNVTIEIFGRAEIGQSEPFFNQSFASGSVADITCGVTDTYSGNHVPDYDVGFFVQNSTDRYFLGTNTTGAATNATFHWDTSGYSNGQYRAGCNISNQLGDYYYASTDNETNTTVFLSGQVNGVLEAFLTSPANNTVVAQNRTFEAEVSITCRQQDCGSVNATFRYNSSGRKADTAAPENSGRPFHTVGTNTKNCDSDLTVNETCITSWQVNATGKPNSYHSIDSEATGTTAKTNDTVDKKLTIDIVLILNVNYTEIDFPAGAPSRTSPNFVSGPGNPTDKYFAELDENSNNANGGVWIKSTFLNHTTAGSNADRYTIPPENTTWTLKPSCSYAASNSLHTYFSQVLSFLKSGDNFTQCFFQEIPQGKAAGIYRGNITIKVNATN